ncbi:MAG TPA: hypothetical protein VEC99_13085 [Clostridia bacterium]|nr:hypothetical protein [Clostridia bacterium]
MLGSVPINPRTAKRLLEQSRSWIEAAQFYEKNQLGLGQLFLNSVRLTAIACLLCDTVSLLRAHALLRRPPDKPDLLRGLRPNQPALPLE